MSGRLPAIGLALVAPLLGASAALAHHPRPDPTFKVILERGPCFGSCPVYTVEVDADGQVIFKGDRFVSCQGERRWRISPAAVAKLESQVDGSGFFGFHDAYRGHVTDLPTYTVTVTRRGRTKQVVDYVGGTVGMPAEMTTLEVVIDDAADTLRCLDPPRTAP